MFGRVLCRGLCLTVLSLLVLTAVEAAPITPEKAYNPQPLEGDIIFKLPCDGYMVFRKVYTSDSSSRLKDYAFTAGTSEASSELAQSETHRYIQGSFHDEKGYFYLMSKYEVTEGQFNRIAAFANGKEVSCPAAKLSIRDCFPKNNLSWFEAMESTRHLSRVLAELNKEIPKGCFARLPTDVEWEFATRGGRQVTQEQFSAAVFPFAKSGESIADYAWYKGATSASDGKVRPIGLKKPNPLGFFDLLGNVSEMLFEPFQATSAGRLHGQSGGFIVRGGSVINDEGDMISALRSERGYFNGRGQETKSRDMGFRVVLSVPVATDIKAVRELNKEVVQSYIEKEAAEAKAKAQQMAKPLVQTAEELYALALQFEQGTKDQQQDPLKALHLYSQAAEKGDLKSQLRLGTLYYEGEGVQQDYIQSMYWYQKAAKQGDSLAQARIGLLYYDGLGVEQDYDKALVWLKQAAEKQNAEAQVAVGKAYYEGNGVDYDEEQAVMWYKKAADQGHAQAQVLLGNAYYGGEGVEQDYKKAVEWYRKAAAQGNSDAQCNLGDAYDLGRGVKKNAKESITWFTKAAEQGNTTAQINLGLAYEYGEGVQQDDIKSAYWFSKAAEQGDAFAQYNMGQAYALGRGVKKDYEQALYWYAKAAEQGNFEAQDAMESLQNLEGM